MKVRSKMGSKVDGEIISIKVDRSIQVVLLMIRSMDMEGITSFLELNIKVIGVVG